MNPHDLWTSLLIGMVIWLAAAATEAHPGHVTWAEAEWNSATGMLEIALRVPPSDLEAVIRQRTGRQLVLEDEQAEQAVEGYLRETFRMISPQGGLTAWSWVGYEVTVPAAWLYFEVPMPSGPEGWTIVNELLLHHPRQLNTVQVRHGERQATLQFWGDRTRQRIVLPDGNARQ